jgi:DNA-directed RNA polymerase sigma subunit (sigma70/sigma32)
MVKMKPNLNPKLRTNIRQSQFYERTRLSKENRELKRTLIHEFIEELHKSNLSPRQLNVILNSFGLEGNEKKSYNAIGREEVSSRGKSVSQERIRQVRKQAITKLARNIRIREIYKRLLELEKEP